MSVTNVALSFQIGSTWDTSDMHSKGAVFIPREGGGHRWYWPDIYCGFPQFLQTKRQWDFRLCHGQFCTGGNRYVTGPPTKYSKPV